MLFPDRYWPKSPLSAAPPGPDQASATAATAAPHRALARYDCIIFPPRRRLLVTCYLEDGRCTKLSRGGTPATTALFQKQISNLKRERSTIPSALFYRLRQFCNKQAKLLQKDRSRPRVERLVSLKNISEMAGALFDRRVEGWIPSDHFWKGHIVLLQRWTLLRRDRSVL